MVPIFFYKITNTMNLAYCFHIQEVENLFKSWRLLEK